MEKHRHWAEKFIGRPYEAGSYDCADFVKSVMWEQFKKKIDLPSDRTWRGRTPQELVEWSHSLAEPTEDPKTGDCVLMGVVGNRRSLGCHIGVYARSHGQAWCLHAIRKAGVIFCPISNLVRLNMEVMGYYRWVM